MIYIAHRINASADLKSVPRHFGVELDLRDYDGRIVVGHEPFSGGEDFESYLKSYEHGTMIANIKSEGIEERARELLNSKGLSDWFFLDSSFPMINKYSQAGERRFAVRHSEFETVDTALAVAGRVDWVWVDCFTDAPKRADDLARLKAAGMKLCVVSPELHGRPESVDEYAKMIAALGVEIDAVCAKMPYIGRWQKLFGS